MMISHRRLAPMWNVLVILFSVAAIGKARADDDVAINTSTTLSPSDFSTGPSSSNAPVKFLNLPSLSVTLDVEKQDDALIPFQDHLKTSIEEHLENFFRNKLLNSEVGVPALVDVELESHLVWDELHVVPKEIKEKDGTEIYEKVVFYKKYEVKGISYCKIKLQIDPFRDEEGNEEKEVYLSQSLINLFFLEAFENEHYFDLMHRFLTNPLLRDIISADIKISDVGFVHPYDENGNLQFEKDDEDFFSKSIDIKYNGKTSKINAVVIVAIVFVVFFFMAIFAIWFYLCVVRKDKRFSFWKGRCGRSRPRDDSSNKGSSGTGSDSDEERDVDSDGSEDGEEDGEGGEGEEAVEDTESVGTWISKNLDAWASSITSIPLRDVENVRRKKKKGKAVKRPYFRPSDEHSSSLDCITEADNESWCSSVRSARSRSSSSNRSTKSSRTQKRSSSRARNLEGSKSFDSGKVSDVIYEGDAEDANDDEEKATQISPLIERQLIKHEKTEHHKISPLMQRQLINLLPSEDEEDRAWNDASGYQEEDAHNFGEF